LNGYGLHADIKTGIRASLLFIKYYLSIQFFDLLCTGSGPSLTIKHLLPMQ